MKNILKKKTCACVIIFARAPILGHVKTRLAKDLNETLTLGLYRRFVGDIVKKITDAGHCLKIFHDPPGSLPLMKDWLGNHHDYALQEGETLGQKMANAFVRVFEIGFRQAVLMGTDIPDLPGKIISHALSSLDAYDAAIGASLDGGYYLIGFSAKKFLAEAFENIPWSTPGVFEETMTAFASAGLRVKQLPSWRDVDTYEDLALLIHSLTHHPDRAPHTAAFLKHAGLIPD